MIRICTLRSRFPNAPWTLFLALRPDTWFVGERSAIEAAVPVIDRGVGPFQVRRIRAFEEQISTQSLQIPERTP